MSEEIKNGVTAEAPVKKRRRGVNNETQAVSQLKFHENDAASNGLFAGRLLEAKVDWSVAGDNSSFAGLKAPRLTLHFTSLHTNPAEQRHVYQTLFPVESNVATIPGGSDEWRVNANFNWIKHILQVFYLKKRQFTEKEEDALVLPFEDFDDEGNYVAVDPQEVLNGYGVLFNNVVLMLDGKFDLAEGETPKCCYKDDKGNPINIWMKLLRHIKTKKGWVNVGQNGELGFGSFVGSGVIEIMKPNTPPAILRLDPSKESITPKETKQTPTFGGQAPMGMMGGSVMAGMSTGIPNNNSAFAAAGAEGDMPF